MRKALKKIALLTLISLILSIVLQFGYNMLFVKPYVP